MFMDITHYKSKRKGKRGPIPLEGKREPHGRLSRAASVDQHMVYFVALEDSKRIKVGRTNNIARRIKSYSQSGGSEARCLAQLIVKTKEDCCKLETAAIHYLQARYERHGREWFDIPESELAQAVCEIVKLGGVDVDKRGAPGIERDLLPSTFQYAEIKSRELILKKGRRSAVS